MRWKLLRDILNHFKKQLVSPNEVYTDKVASRWGFFCSKGLFSDEILILNKTAP